MAKRITSIPIEHGWTVTESAANTYTETSLTLPVAILGAGRVQGIEIMQMVAHLPNATLEVGQSNTARFQLVRDAQTTIIGYASDDLLLLEQHQYTSEDATAIENTTQSNRKVVRTEEFQPEGVGNGGKILAERVIAVGLLGGGNPAALNAQGVLKYHIVELSAEELIAQLALDNS